MPRSEIFTRIRSALVDVRERDPERDVPVAWEFGRPTAVDDVVGLFIARVIDYKATVVRAADLTEVGRLVADALAAHSATSVVVPAGVPADWHALAEKAGVEVRRDDPPLSHAVLNDTSAVLTAAAVGMAETGTIGLDHRDDQGRRALSLVPDMHVCVIRTDQL
ncbi:MAG: LUD domain-containing protein, partial [Propionibacteriaceae bacterium]|nr:LUD domain-containing protein [Propionibacteriaceae bacterium]